MYPIAGLHLALEAARRIDAILGLERPLIGLAEDPRLGLRRQYVAPQVEALKIWMASGPLPSTP